MATMQSLGTTDTKNHVRGLPEEILSLVMQRIPHCSHSPEFRKAGLLCRCAQVATCWAQVGSTDVVWKPLLPDAGEGSSYAGEGSSLTRKQRYLHCLRQNCTDCGQNTQGNPQGKVLLFRSDREEPLCSK